MLLSEMVRKIREEAKLVEDTNSYTQNANSQTDWVTKVSKQIILNVAQLVYAGFEGYFYSPSSGRQACGNVRMLVDGIPVISTGTIHVNAGSAAIPRVCWLYLSAGTHTFDFQIAVTRTPQYTDLNPLISVRNIYIYKVCFSDSQLGIFSGEINVPAQSEATVLEKTLQLPKRALPIGKIRQEEFQIVLYCRGPTRNSVIDGSDSANYYNWKLFINDVRVGFTEKVDDYNTNATGNTAYGCGAYAKLISTHTQDLNIKVKCYNGFSEAKTVTCTVAIYACPWIIPALEYEPLSLNFPQGSTLYLVLEPFTSNPTKTVKLGFQRAWSFGDGTNFYSIASGTDILSWNYTFEAVEVGSCALLISGSGACISIIAVDVR